VGLVIFDTMLSILGVLILLAPQLDPALAPQKALKPSLPKINENACPFEGCQFGAWTATDGVQLYSTWKGDRNPAVKISKGEPVTALTGIHITFEPDEIQVTAPIPQYALKPGDTVFGYRNLGEGFFNAWFNGYWVEEFDGSGVDGFGCEKKCNAKLLKPGHSEWWVEIQTRDGAVGWTQETTKFDGKDALGG